ncbi:MULTISPECIES: RES family NAD+ phosphorylase [unclassified Meiothermus]|uniref:RES family NAD+ phosphorylase n=1 Tax=unclassified Meiothermus TaxID=370471 RepID=UPI000D7C6ACD|nr:MULTISPECIES: RES family NAD+ phosphorylase [unclassified Meiothermus]PZA07737.1 RES domain-containing protein [Meiothermus sp. Pnk-1]RYM37508.1 RES domain-containing protein [Meiothermus sp. PNK-Is4]
MPRLQAWRLVARHRAETAFDGEGSFRYGNRWNHPGTRVVYLASTASLAALEVLVHAESYAELPEYLAFPVSFDAELVLDPPRLPPDWRADPAPPSTKELGSRWAAEGASVLLRVPSAVVPWEHHYVLNVSHPQYRRVHVGEPRPFAFDPRLLKG